MYAVMKEELIFLYWKYFYIVNQKNYSVFRFDLNLLKDLTVQFFNTSPKLRLLQLNKNFKAYLVFYDFTAQLFLFPKDLAVFLSSGDQISLLAMKLYLNF